MSGLVKFRIGGIVAALVGLTLLWGCGRADWTLRVRNDTAKEWLVRSQFSAEYPDLFQVRRIAPHAEGGASFWDGDRDFDIEFLDIDCSVVGVFAPDSGTAYSVRGIAGLDATISEFDPSIDNRNNPDISIVTNCGGSVFQ